MNKEMDKKEEAREKAMNDVKLYLANDWNLKEETPEFFLSNHINLQEILLAYRLYLDKLQQNLLQYFVLNTHQPLNFGC